MFNFCFLSAQKENNDFEFRYNAIRVLVNKNITETKKQANLMIIDAEAVRNYKYVSKGYYMLSFASMLEDCAEESFKFANKALAVAEKYNYKEGQALALRSIGTQYARMNALDIAKKNFDKALHILEDLKTEEVYEIRGLILNSKMVSLGDGTTPKEVAEKLKVSLLVVENYEKLSNVDLKKNLLVSAYTNVGYNYSDGKKYDSARYFFQNALRIVKPDNLYMLASIHHDLGYLYKEERRLKEAEFYLKKALTFINSNDNSYRSKKIEILKNLALVYDESGDKHLLIETREKLHVLQEDKRRKDIKYLEKELQKKDNALLVKEQKNNYTRIALVFLILIIAGIGIFYWCNNRANKNKYSVLRKQFEEMKNYYSLMSSTQSPISNDEKISQGDEIQNNEENEEDFNASDKTIERILLELNSFEKSDKFLQPNFTISHLAIKLDTNTKTLSQIIKQFKKQNFNAYINQLRILHFFTKVEEDETFRKYKLAYISEYLGYSSAGAFSNTFKAITGILPSVYLKQYRSNKGANK